MTRDGFVSDSLDILNDIYPFEAGKHTPAVFFKRDSVVTMHVRFGRTPEVIATQLKLNIADVKAVLATLTQSEPVQDKREPALSAWI